MRLTMPKALTTIYACTHCDAQHPKWLGQCSTCGSWGTLTQTAAAPRMRSAADAGIRPESILPLDQIDIPTTSRTPTGLAEFDAAIGGGIVPGSLLLLAGEPGIGKSTLVLQVAAAIAAAGDVLYISGEETASQVRNRAERIGIPMGRIRFLATADGTAAAATIARMRPALAVVDSVQTLAIPDLPVDAGGVTQVRALANILLTTAKTSDVPIIITGHVTKDGAIAGPKTLEHLVDQVAVLDGEPTSDIRILRTTKNRFGATDVAGVFTLTARGLAACPDPSAAFLSGNAAPTPGTAVCATTIGNRTLLVEVQALVTRSAFGQPQRRAVGVDINRLHVLLAVLTRHAGVNFSTSDVHVATVGGFHIEDPAADLAIAAALTSCATDHALPVDAYIGEVGLDGSIRPIRGIERRIQEAVRLGRARIASAAARTAISGATNVPIRTVRDLVAQNV